MKWLVEQFRRYWPMIKSLQTGLLLSTGLAGYMSSKCPIIHWTTMLGLFASLSLTISGSTVLNMWYDRDIDSRMKRTCRRPLPSGAVRPPEALGLGLAMCAAGLVLAFVLSPLYALVVFAGIFFDVVIYTIWLKRRTPWSIIWGGVSGGMPILAGRVLGVGQLDIVGVVMAFAVLFWIPTHILTFSIRNFEDYQAANVPTCASAYGFQKTRYLITASSVIAAIFMGLCAIFVGMSWGYLRLLAVLSVGLFGFALWTLRAPSEKVHFGLFKYASLYMLSSMLMFIMDGL